MTPHTRNRFFDSQLMPRWNHHGHGGGVRFEDWLPVTAIPTPRISLAVRRAAIAARTATCQECGKMFIRGNKARAKTCSPTCAQQMRFREWLKAKNKPQAACAPCLYRLGYGVKRMQKTLRISTPLYHVRNAGLVVQSTPERRSMTARLANRTRYARVQPERYAKREAKARLLADLRLLRQVIGEMRRELTAKARTDPQVIERLQREARAYYHKNKKRIARRMKEAEALRPGLRMRRRLATRMYILIRSAGQVKRRSNLLFGCSDLHLKRWLQDRFKRGMTWDNYGEWEVDHIIPCASFNLSKKEDQDKCFHYTNLQPLWRRDNRVKHDTMPTNHQPELVLHLPPPPTPALGTLRRSEFCRG